MVESALIWGDDRFCQVVIGMQVSGKDCAYSYYDNLDLLEP